MSMDVTANDKVYRTVEGYLLHALEDLRSAQIDLKLEREKRRSSSQLSLILFVLLMCSLGLDCFLLMR